MNPNYSEEQIKDIKEREEKALAALKELELTPAAIVSKLNNGNDTFVDKVQCYLQDTKYSKKEESIPSPVEMSETDA